MASLTGNAINTSYQGILKTLDNAAINGVNRVISDGLGNALPLEASTTTIKFTGNADFTSATVTGISAGNLVNGTGADSLKNVDSLVTNATTAGGAQAIALGNGATSSNAQTIAIGNGALANNFQSVAIGDGAEATGVGAVAMGQYSNANGIYASAWGRTSVASSDGSVAFGQQAEVPFGVAGGVAMGRQVVADLADTTHVRALKIVAPDGGTGGNGITMLSPNGTAGVITLTDASELAVDGTPIGGGGGAAGLINDTPEDSLISAPGLTTLPAYSLAPRGIALGNNARVDSTFAQDGIAIGNNAWVRQAQGIAIGEDTESYANGVSIGANAKVTSTVGQHVAIGLSTRAGWGGVALGTSAEAQAKYSAAVGRNAEANVAEGSIALGSGVIAETAYTATVNLFQIAAYATMNYVNDAAAATGGIPLGGVYHTDGALKIRIV